MPYVNKPRPVRKEYLAMKANPEEVAKRKKRRAARDAFDKAGISRKGKDIDHKTPLSLGGGNARSNLWLKSPSENRSFARTPSHKPKRGG